MAYKKIGKDVNNVLLCYIISNACALIPSKFFSGQLHVILTGKFFAKIAKIKITP